MLTRRAAYMTRKNGGRREPEYRLWMLVPAMFLSPAGLIIYGVSSFYKLSWVGIFFGNAIFQASNFHGFSILMAYMVRTLLVGMKINCRSIVIIVTPPSCLGSSLPVKERLRSEWRLKFSTGFWPTASMLSVISLPP